MGNYTQSLHQIGMPHTSRALPVREDVSADVAGGAFCAESMANSHFERSWGGWTKISIECRRRRGERIERKAKAEGFRHAAFFRKYIGGRNAQCFAIFINSPDRDNRVLCTCVHHKHACYRDPQPPDLKLIELVFKNRLGTAIWRGKQIIAFFPGVVAPPAIAKAIRCFDFTLVSLLHRSRREPCRRGRHPSALARMKHRKR